MGLLNVSPPTAANPPLHTIHIISTHPLPASAAHWPVSASHGSPPTSDGAYVLCGPADAVRELLRTHKRPLYVVTDAISRVLDVRPLHDTAAVRNYPALSLAHGEWQEAVATICSLHVSTVPEMVLHHACEQPERVAVHDAGCDTSFASLCSLAWSLGDALATEGIELAPETALGVVMPPSLHAIVAHLGLQMRGLRPCVLSPFGPLRRYQLARVPCAAILVASSDALAASEEDEEDEAEAEAVPPCINVTTLQLDPSLAPWSVAARLPAAATDLRATAFVDWTSGSTGRPKAMAVTRWRLAHWVRWRAWHFPLQNYGRRVAMGLFLAWYWHLPLCQGGTLLLVPPQLTVDVAGLMQYLTEARVDWVDCLTPGQLHMLTEQCGSTGRLHVPPTLRHVMVSGEALPVATASAFLRAFTGLTMSNVLSTTETAADICMLKRVDLAVCDAAAAAGLTNVPVRGSADGEVVWGNEVLFEAETGRIVHRGWNMEHGYLTGEDAEAFSAGEADGAGDDAVVNVYSSGDRGRTCGEWLCIEGRLDSVVKVLGHRVDLAGIEATLVQCTAVKDCVALVFNDKVWACVVTADAAAVTAFVRARFPRGGAQPAVLAVGAIPYSHTGKRDRSKLLQQLPAIVYGTGEHLASPSMTSAKAVADRVPVLDGQSAPATAEASAEEGGETRVRAAMVQQLGRTLGRDDDFFEAGGTSASALRLCAALGVRVAALFAHPTAARLAAHMRGADGDVCASLSAPLPPVRGARHALSVAGMAVRLPGAASLNELWQLLQKRDGDGLSSVPGAKPGPLSARKGVVPDEGLELSLWGLTAERAATMSREQRLLLELAHEALEDAGYWDEKDQRLRLPGRVGVFVCGGSLPHLDGLDQLRAERPGEHARHGIGLRERGPPTTLRLPRARALRRPVLWRRGQPRQGLCRDNPRLPPGPTRSRRDGGHCMLVVPRRSVARRPRHPPRAVRRCDLRRRLMQPGHGDARGRRHDLGCRWRLQAIQRRRSRHGASRRVCTAGADRRPVRTCIRHAQGRRRQQRWRPQRHIQPAIRGRAGGGDADGAQRRGSLGRAGRLRGGPRHWHESGRPH